MRGKKPENILKNKKYWLGTFILLFFIAIAVFIIIPIANKDAGEPAPDPKKLLAALSPNDRKILDVYADLYGVTKEKVVLVKADKDSWEEVNNQLSKERFTIPEDEKYRMNEEGYSLSDLYDAEQIAVKTGSDVHLLIKAKGKEGKQWSEALHELGLSEKSTAEHLGLTKEQAEDCKKKGMNEDDMIQIAVLIFNLNKSYEEVMKETDDGKNIQKLQREAEAAHERR